MKKHKVMGMILCLLSLAAFLLAYNRLPQQVPIYYDMRGQADGFLSKIWADIGIPGLPMPIRAFQIVKVTGQKKGGIWRLYLLPGGVGCDRKSYFAQRFCDRNRKEGDITC